MRKYVFLGLVVVALVAMTSVALAGGYATWTPGGPNGTSPHEGYTDSSTKCKVCHAVHNATSGGEALLRSTRAEACVYCHITPGVSSIIVYDATTANYTNDTDNNHSSDHDGNYADYNGCVSCHSVHGANTIAGSPILKESPAMNGAGAVAGDATTITDFCRDCHNKSGTNDDDNLGCFSANQGCHDTGSYPNTVEGNISPDYFSATRDGVTHVMTTTLTAPGGATVAWTTSENCDSCHAADDGTQARSYPHYTAGAAQFLTTEYPTANTGMDAVCLQCHLNTGDPGTATLGVGKTF